jgi:RNA polymerase sigma-70 factor (ECF subfamily)
MLPELGQVVELLTYGKEPAEEARRESIDRVLDLRRLYEEQADFVRRTVIRLGGPRTDVDDLVQDVFIVALRKGSTFEGRSAPRTWLYGIAIKVVGAARRRARIRELFGLRSAVMDSVERRTPEDLFERREASRTVYEVLDRIAEKKRTVFILFELEGLSGEEIALVVGCPLKTVWTRLHHARREFVGLLEKRQRDEARRDGATVGRKP